MPKDDKRPLTKLSEQEKVALQRVLLSYFASDRNKPSMGLSANPPFNAFSQRAITEMIQSYVASGILEKTGHKSDAAYRLTSLGASVKAAQVKPKTRRKTDTPAEAMPE